MIFSLKDKVVIITGGSSGIGRAISLLFAQQMAEVHIFDFQSPISESTIKEVKQFNNLAKFHSVDITNEQLVADEINKFSIIDILINNAGIAQVGNVENTSSDDFQKIFDVNVKGAFNCIKSVIPKMIKNNSGVILNMASVASSVGIQDRFGYSMTKGAIKSMTLSIAKDYISSGIRCNCISPARVHTPFVDGFIQKNYPNNQQEMYEKLSSSQPIGRMARPIEIAHLALYLCSDEASFATGCDYPLDGGFLHLNN